MACNVEPTIMLMLLIILDSLQRGYCIGFKRKEHVSIPKYQKITKQQGPIAADDDLKIYENEHLQLHIKEANENNILEWPLLEHKDLNECCFKFVHHIIPNAQVGFVTGTMNDATLRYENKTSQYFAINQKIIVVWCERWNVQAKNYYMTRAPDTHCIYSLLRDKGYNVNIFSIINKHCGFEWPTDSHEIANHIKKESIIEKMHRWTGQPIAKEKYIQEYEQEHQELYKKEANGYLPWPYITQNLNLDEYCNQYLQKCNPRKSGNIKGNQMNGQLHYQNYKKEETTLYSVIIVKCTIKLKTKYFFYITRASTNNCVYALNRKIYNGNYEIVFKHCDFEYKKEKKMSHIRECNVLPDLKVLPNYEMKEENLDTLETLNVPANNDIKQENSNSLELLQFF